MADYQILIIDDDEDDIELLTGAFSESGVDGVIMFSLVCRLLYTYKM